MGKCRDCYWWQNEFEVNSTVKIKDSVKRKFTHRAGICFCDKFLMSQPPRPDGLSFSYKIEKESEGANDAFETGENFGCVNFKEK